MGTFVPGRFNHAGLVKRPDKEWSLALQVGGWDGADKSTL